MAAGGRAGVLGPASIRSRPIRAAIAADPDEPNIYLDNLVRDFSCGRQDRHPQVETPRELATLREPVVINCTGLGSRDLFGDEELIPLKVTLTVLTPQPEVNYPHQRRRAAGAGREPRIHMMARNDGIVLGGTRSAACGRWNRRGGAQARRRRSHRGLWCDEGARA